MTSGRSDATGWVVVVPVKRLAMAKTRLELPPGTRAEVALAMALDVVTAALDCATVRGVVVITDEPDAAAATSALGALVVADAPDAGLNPALRHGAEEAAAAFPGCGVATLASDVPAVRPAELLAALAAGAAADRALVSDSAGTGTVLLTAAPGVVLQPAFGTGSAARHRAAGARDVTDLRWTGLRSDVDTVADLDRVRALGVGPYTQALLRGLSLPAVRPGGGALA